MRLDLHCHTEASSDCQTSFIEVIDRCRERGIRVQAITDHNVVWGAQRLQTLIEHLGLKEQLQIIDGEEISTQDGELIGLFLKETVPAGMSAEDTVKAIHMQSGLVLLPHGFDPLKRHRLRPAARQRIAGEIDIVESFNARISAPYWNWVAARWAATHGLPCSGGSDAHTPEEIGDAWSWSESAPGKLQTGSDLLTLLRRGSVGGHWTHPVPALIKKVWKERGPQAVRRP